MDDEKKGEQEQDKGPSKATGAGAIPTSAMAVLPKTFGADAVGSPETEKTLRAMLSALSPEQLQQMELAWSWSAAIMKDEMDRRGVNPLLGLGFAGTLSPDFVRMLKISPDFPFMKLKVNQVAMDNGATMLFTEPKTIIVRFEGMPECLRVCTPKEESK